MNMFTLCIYLIKIQPLPENFETETRFYHKEEIPFEKFWSEH